MFDSSDYLKSARWRKESQCQCQCDALAHLYVSDGTKQNDAWRRAWVFITISFIVGRCQRIGRIWNAVRVFTHVIFIRDWQIASAAPRYCVPRLEHFDPNRQFWITSSRLTQRIHIHETNSFSWKLHFRPAFHHLISAGSAVCLSYSLLEWNLLYLY